MLVSYSLDFDPDESPANEYKNLEFFYYFLHNYIPFTPLWSGILLNNKERLSNAPVERWFGIVKNIIAKRVMRQKSSRLIRKLRKYVLFIFKENSFQIPKLRCSSKTSVRKSKYSTISAITDDGLASQEIWEKKEKVLHNNFLGTSLKKALRSSESLELANEINSDLCIYCKKGNLEYDNLEYLKCDKCDGRVHIICLEDLNRSFSGAFFCKFCLDTEKEIVEKGELSCVSDIPKYEAVCSNYFDKNYRKSVQDLSDIEQHTRDQRLSHIWFEERAIRVTASNFGRICNSKNNNSLVNFFKQMQNSKSIYITEQ
ncbi:hypothetical protein JTB14_011700 [Gonioctena quinquepunctata]|nr:hypothetical protein JTB14_011700 [Gonioctena quinquepunctata]